MTEVSSALAASAAWRVACCFSALTAAAASRSLMLRNRLARARACTVPRHYIEQPNLPRLDRLMPRCVTTGLKASAAGCAPPGPGGPGGAVTPGSVTCLPGGHREPGRGLGRESVAVRRRSGAAAAGD